MNHYSAIKRCELLIYATSLMDFTMSILRKETRHKSTYYKNCRYIELQKIHIYLQPWLPYSGVIFVSESVWQWLESFWIVITGERVVLLASMGTDQECCKISCNSVIPWQQRILQPQVSIVPLLTNPEKELWKRKIRCKLRPGTEGRNAHKEKMQTLGEIEIEYLRPSHLSKLIKIMLH